MAENEQQSPVIYWRINEWFKDLNENTRKSLKIFHDELILANRQVNLISAKSIFIADAMHFAPSIFASQVIMRSNPGIDHVFDFESGSGFPGIVFSILYPNLKLTLVETDSAKCSFLNSIKTKLDLKNMIILNSAIEKLEASSVNFASCRTGNSISKVMLSCRKIMNKGGIIYHIKGDEWAKELAEIPSQLCSVWLPSLVGEFKIPGSSSRFFVIKTEKISV